MATVITNLLSAIPWIGTDFVQFATLFTVYKILRNILINNSFTLTPIGIPRYNKPIDTNYYNSISKEFLAIFIGFVDGDGHIRVSKNGLYIKVELVIQLSKVDSATLEHINKKLKLGHIEYYKEVCTLIINRKELQIVLFPLINYHNMFFLTETRKSQFNKAIFVFIENIIKYSDFINKYKNDGSISNSNVYYKNLPF